MGLKVQKRLLIILSIAAALYSNLAEADTLKIGRAANNAGPIEVPLNKPTALNFKSKAEILSLRKRIVDSMPILLDGDYQPSESVFGHIEDNRPWWGMHGAFVWGAGNHSIEGDSEESRFLVNPFLLVGANSGSALIWKTEATSQADLKNPSFPFCWLPASLKWYPTQPLVQVTYDITGFNRQIADRRSKLILPTVKIDQFGLIAYNARDFGFNYIYLDCKKSINIVNSVQVEEPVLISQMIHCGGSSQYPGGCNNMSPAIADIDRIAFTALPARARVALWKEKPEDVNTPADMTCWIDFH
jgi:hypothetical protein